MRRIGVAGRDNVKDGARLGGDVVVVGGGPSLLEEVT